jgi:hypothetical protein
MRQPLRTILILWFAFSAIPAEAGPWGRESGKGILQIGFSTIGYSKAYGDDSKKHTLSADVRDNVFQAYAEYGLPNDFTIAAMVPFKFLSATPYAQGAGKISNSGLGDLDISLRRSWYCEDGFTFAGELLLGLPIGSRKDANGLYLGDGEFNVNPRFLAGKSFYPIPLYLTAELGFNYRAQGFSHDVPFGLEIGYGILEKKLYVILQILGRESLSNQPTLPTTPSVSDIAASTIGAFGNNMEFLAIIPKIYFKATENVGISFSYATAAHGRNVAGGVVLAGGVIYEF